MNRAVGQVTRVDGDHQQKSAGKEQDRVHLVENFAFQVKQVNIKGDDRDGNDQAPSRGLAQGGNEKGEKKHDEQISLKVVKEVKSAEQKNKIHGKNHILKTYFFESILRKRKKGDKGKKEKGGISENDRLLFGMDLEIKIGEANQDQP